MKHLLKVTLILPLAWLVWSCGPTNEKVKEAVPPPVAAVKPQDAPVAVPAPTEVKKAPAAVAVAPPKKEAPPVTLTPAAPVPAVEIKPPPVVAPVPVEVKPAAPLVAPDLKLESLPGGIQPTPVVVRLQPLPPGTLVKYTLDGSDPASGKTWPPAGLTVDSSGQLKVWAALPGGPASLTDAVLTVGEVWVQIGGTGDGSWNHPVATLDEAITKATALGVHRIRFFAGTYPVKADLKGPWDISGGWKSPGVADQATTILQGTKQSGTTQLDPGFALKVTPGAAVSLANLEVRSPNSSFGTAVLVGKNATLKVAGSRLVGGSGSYGYGLNASEATLVSVTDSTLSGGDGGSSFALSSEKSSITAIRSTFDGGTGNAVSYGLNLTLSKLNLVSSVVWGGTGASCYGIGLYSSNGSRIAASTILGGKGASAWAFYLSESDPEIVNCLIGASGKSKSYGVFANYGKSLPRALRSNAFFGANSVAFSGVSLGKTPATPGPDGAFLDASGAPFAGQKANIVAEPALGPAPEFRTLASTPAVILKGAEPLGNEASTDRGQKSRDGSTAIGAWAVIP